MVGKTYGKRLLSNLGLAPTIVRSLQDACILYDDDVRKLTPTELSQASGLTQQECCEVLKLVQSEPQAAPTLLDMIESRPTHSTVSTLCSALDGLLGGGVPLQAVTEVAGTPGIGKTQLCIQLCVSVQMPSVLGGMEGEAVIMDTEGSVAPIRVKEMAEYAVKHFHKVSDLSEHFTVETVLKNIHYYRCLNQLSVVASIKNLPKLLTERPAIRLLVIDSLAFHLRHDVPDNRVKAGLLASMTQTLVQLATKHNLAVLVTNQMTTRVLTGDRSELVPALGESWAHCPTVRLVCCWVDGVRTARLIKAPHRANASATYQVTAAGIRDVDSGCVESAPAGLSTNESSSPVQASKRRRES